jgi:oligosaccharyltransferase complex subunit alpha (ribophorin I)
MDTTGRTTLTLTARNIIDEVRDREIIVTYDYPFAAGLRKPLVIFGATFSLFVAAWVLGSLDTGITGARFKKSS